MFSAVPCDSYNPGLTVYMYIQDVGKLEADMEATHGGWGGEQLQIGNLWAESNSYAFVSNGSNE